MSGCVWQVSSGSMGILGVGVIGVLDLLGVDIAELLRERWWMGELGYSRLRSWALVLMLRRS